MGTVDGTSHQITEWVSFVFITGGVQRQICAFVRPERCPTLDLFLLLGLPWLHSVKAVIEICRSQIKIGDKSLGEICTILQGPTFEFAKAHRLFLQPTQIPFKNALRTEQFEQKEKALEINAKKSMTRAYFENPGRILGKNLNSKESTNRTFDKQSNKKFDDIPFSSETEDSITVGRLDYEEYQAINDYKSTSTDPDVSDEYEYFSDEDSEDVTWSHMGKDHVTRMTETPDNENSSENPKSLLLSISQNFNLAKQLLEDPKTNWILTPNPQPEYGVNILMYNHKDEEVQDYHPDMIEPREICMARNNYNNDDENDPRNRLPYPTTRRPWRRPMSKAPIGVIDE
ncbi:hypothetical protein GcM3_016021 [Golovinomyces cichoracearum]|uniref:Uncharacterized protein n=1 Tax=Golovinomyces cichoracearum TaxID=62708 RepID=A0A420J8M9_9PEZI|nr:hypothetical protein GcM3_016021 [Golovinomyces cichoracearum]